jgi:hypothetical protein
MIKLINILKQTVKEGICSLLTAKNHILNILNTSNNPINDIEVDYKSWDTSMHDAVISTGACEEWNTQLGILLKQKLGSSVSVWQGEPNDPNLPEHYIVKYKDYILDYTAEQFFGYGLGNNLPDNTMKYTQSEYADIYEMYKWEKII